MCPFADHCYNTETSHVSRVLEDLWSKHNNFSSQLAAICALIGLASVGKREPEADSAPQSTTRRPLIAVLHDKHGDLEKLSEHGIL